MDAGLRILCFNALAYIMLLAYYLYRKRTLNLGIVILGIFTVSAMGSAWYYSFPKVSIFYPNITFIPLLFLFGCIFISIKPLLDFDLRNTTGLNDSNIAECFDVMSYVFSIACLLPFIELLLKLSSVSLAGSFFGQMYETNEDKALYFFSPIGKVCFAVLRHLTDFVILLFFYQLTKRKLNRTVLIGLGLGIVTIGMFKLLSGSRGGVFGLVITVLFYFVIFKNVMQRGRYIFIRKVLLVLFALCVTAIGIVSISRFGYSSSYSNPDASLDRWISQYAGESFVRFTDTVWPMTHTADGDQNFALLKSWFGEYPYADYDTYLSSKEAKVGVTLNVFYTFVGDLYVDFGFVGTILCVICLYGFERYLLRIKKSQYNILQLIVIGQVFVMLCYGFSANVYRTIFIQRELLWPILVAFALLIIQRTRMRSKFTPPECEIILNYLRGSLAWCISYKQPKIVRVCA